MDVENGHVLYIQSTPSYNPNKIIKKPNKDYWNSILENKLSPLTLEAYKAYILLAQRLNGCHCTFYHGVINESTSHLWGKFL